MCGIAGLLHRAGAPIDPVVLARMREFLRHRGPDDEGLWVDGPIGLAHRRLSIVDLSPLGRNPMPNEDGSLQLVCNGEIYDHQIHRTSLRQRGHAFRSGTDTEVILHLYEEGGPDCVAELNGMFAFALWDAPRRRLLLARDRFGVKPLYYTELGDVVAFASEIKAFLALPTFRARADPFALAEHFAFQNTLGDRTFFADVKLLPAGHYLLVENGRLNVRQYWDLRFAPDPAQDFDACARQLRERFTEAVTRQLMSDVPLGTYLSGGMDTGSISAVAARANARLHTFTCGFDLPDERSELEAFFDEREESRRLAHELGTVHHELDLGSDAMAPALATVVWHLDEPRVGISYQVYYTAAMIRRYVTVVLSGVGGDELFAGYPWRYEQVVGLDAPAFESTYYRLSTRFFSDTEQREFFTPDICRALNGFSTRDSFRAVLRAAPNDDPLHAALYFDFKTFLNGLLLVDDKLTMAHSVEARVPFLDNDLVDLVQRIPSAFKLHDGRSKRILRAAMRGLLPDDTLTRRKQGFTPPDQSWYKGPMLAVVRELIAGSRARARGYFRPAAVEQILDDHLSGRRNNRFLIWSLMCFEWWNRLFIDRDPLPPPPAARPERPHAAA